MNARGCEAACSGERSPILTSAGLAPLVPVVSPPYTPEI